MLSRDMVQRIDNREQIRTVAERWKAQYYHNGKWSNLWLNEKISAKTIYDKLARLDVETATADDVEAIIGNNSWVGYICSLCGADKSAIVSIDTGYDGIVMLCRPCIIELAKFVPLTREELF